MIRVVGRRAVPGWACLFAMLCVAGPALGQPEAGTLRVCADPNNLPFSNDREEGFENRIAALVGRELGADVEYSHNPDFDKDIRIFFKVLYHFGAKGGA